MDLINQIVDDREPYLARQQQKNPKSPITDDQKHSVIAKSGVYSKDVATKFGSSLLEASVLPSFHVEHEGITKETLHFLIDSLSVDFGTFHLSFTILSLVFFQSIQPTTMHVMTFTIVIN